MKNADDSVIAIVVTYNRKKLLLECLDAILQQSIMVNKILIIDNASTDGTSVFLKQQGYLSNSRIDYILMDFNSGGAGGFYEGLRRSVNCEDNWIWLMDDDTIPTRDCLEKLFAARDIITSEGNKLNKKSETPIAFLASTIYGPHGEYMNLPEISLKQSFNGYAYWYKYLENGIVGIESATFVSLLINKNAIRECGLPCKNFFIWGDDTEYTRRLSTFYGDGYFVGDSKAIHKRQGVKSLEIENETNLNRLDMYHFLYRNTLIIRHYYNDHYRGAILEMIKSIIFAVHIFTKRPYGFQKAMQVIKGYLQGIIQYRKFEKYINNELKGIDY